MKCSSVIKVVYKNYNSVFLRSIGSRYVNIEDDLPGLMSCISNYKLSKMNFLFHDKPAVLWRDKHGNYILRYCSDFNQTKIDF